MITDERLRAAAEKSSNLYLRYMEEGYDAIRPHEFSEPFERKIRKLKKRADHPYFYKMMHKVAVIILAVLIGGSAWLAVDTEARASFFGWVKEVYEELFIYHFEDGRTSNEGKNNYYLTWIPEGYTQILEDSVGNTSSVIYMNDEGEILKFYYASPPDETFWQIESTNTAVEKVTVTGTLSRLSMPKEMPLLMFMMRWTVLPVIPTRRAIPSPSGMTTREIRLPLLTATAIPPAIPTMD